MKFFSTINVKCSRRFSYVLFAPLCIYLFLASCTKEVFEADISGKTITVLAPANNLVTTSSTITFWWETISEPNVKYRIQIVDSSFSSVQQVIVDSTMSGDKFIYSLSPGKYQWRIQAFNSGTETAFQTYNITIQSSPDLSGQTVNLISPANGLVTSEATHVFKWDSVANASGYRFQLINSSSSAIIDLLLTVDTFKTTLADGTYTWKVRAENSFSNSPYSSRTITVDKTAPTAPVGLTPVDGATVPNPVTISWTRASSAIADSLFISADSLFSTNAISPSKTTNTSASFTGVPSTKYFWRLKSVDAAGNWSGFSTPKNFIVQ